ncbi:DUF2591 domain-containing protein (plasmid) [Pseudomonas aeruginosa]|nr:DUF2591 domain-containing protein [Pseudomonas aeruginosa]
MNMVEVQTEELIGAALDWAIATIEGLPIKYDPMAFGNTANGGYWIWDKAPGGMMAKIGDKYSPSSNWSQLGPLIEKRAIVLGNHESGDPSRQGEFWGALIASTRAPALKPTRASRWPPAALSSPKRWAP